MREQIAGQREKRLVAQRVGVDRREDARVERCRIGRQMPMRSFLRCVAVNGVPVAFGSGVVTSPTMSEKFSA